MDDHIYKIIQLAGSSPDSIEQAIQNAVSRAAQSLHDLRWFEVVETRGHIEGGKVNIEGDNSARDDIAMSLARMGYPVVGSVEGMKAAAAKAKSFVSCAIGRIDNTKNG